LDQNPAFPVSCTEKTAAAEGCFLSKYTHHGVPVRQGSKNSRVRRYSIFESVQ